MTNPIMVTFDEVREALRAAVADKGADYVYKRPAGAWCCLYVDTDLATGEQAPGCGVGNALHRLGVPLTTLKEFEGTDAEALLSGLHDRVFRVVDEPEPAWRYLSAFQCQQDAEVEWGEALAVADDILNTGV